MRWFILIMFGSLFIQGCKNNDPEAIKQTLTLSDEMMKYFVNFEVGTKWIYQDTINKSNYDTIELVSKDNMDVNNGTGTLTKGYVLYYKPKVSKDFKVFISPGINNTTYIKVDPLVTATGAIVFENNNGIWTTGVFYFDSLVINGSKYYEVVYSTSNNMYQYEMKISKNTGIVFFIYNNVNPQKPFGAAYKLVKTI